MAILWKLQGCSKVFNVHYIGRIRQLSPPAFLFQNHAKEDFSGKKIGDVKISDAKLVLIKLQSEGKRHSSIKTIRGVLRPAFQLAVYDDILHKNPFGFELAGVVVNDSVRRDAVRTYF